MLYQTCLLSAVLLALCVTLSAQSEADIEGIAAKVATGTSNESALKVSQYYRKTQSDPLAALGWLLFAARSGVPDARKLLETEGKVLFDDAKHAMPPQLRQKVELLLKGGFEPETATAMGNAMCSNGEPTVQSLGWFLLGSVLGDLDSMKMVNHYYEGHRPRERDE